jgi:uncharacterized protein involved in exopolysaccharide biosynthesis
MKEYNEREISFTDILRIIKRRIPTFIIIFLSILILTIVWALFLADEKYKIEQIIEFNGETSTSSLGEFSGLASLAGLSLPSSGNNLSLENEMERIKADKVLEKVVQDLDMVEKANKNKNFLAKLRNITYTERDFINSLKNKIEIEQINKTNFISITYESSDPTTAASIVSLTYDYYLEYEKKQANQKSQKNIDNINTLFDDVKKQYEQINQEVYDYRIEHKINENSIDTGMINYYQETYMKLLQMEQEKEQLEIQIQSIEKNLLEMPEEMKIELINTTQSSIKELKQQLLELNIELETLKLNQPNSPRIDTIETSIQVIQNQIQKQQNEILSDKLKFLSVTDRAKFEQYMNIQTQLELFELSKQVYEKMLRKIDTEINKKSPVVFEYMNLLKDQTIAETKYNMFYNTLEQEKMNLKLHEPKFQIISAAYIPPRPVSPNLNLSLAIGTILGIFIGFLGIFIRDNTDNRVMDEKDVESILKEPDLILENDQEIEKIAKIMYTEKDKNIAIIETQKNKIKNYSKEIFNLLKQTDENLKHVDTTQNIKYEDSIKKYEEAKQTKNKIIRFNSKKDSNFLLFKNIIDKNVVIIKRKSTNKKELFTLNKTDFVIYIK